MKVTWTDEAARAIAREALQRKVGARGLRMILEELMLDLMYHVPGNKKVKELIITDEMVSQPGHHAAGGPRKGRLSLCCTMFEADGLRVVRFASLERTETLRFERCLQISYLSLHIPNKLRLLSHRR